jgi:hypothetical protein
MAFVATHDRSYNPIFVVAHKKQIAICLKFSLYIFEWVVLRCNQAACFPQRNNFIFIFFVVFPYLHFTCERLDLRRCATQPEVKIYQLNGFTGF